MKTINLKDNTSFDVPQKDIESYLFLRNIANYDIATLLRENGESLLIYPHSFVDCKDNMDKQTIVSLRETEKEGKCTRLEIQTSNVVGFIGIGGRNVSICSRFSGREEDCFLHYMLEAICGGNMVNLPHGTSIEQTFDFLLYLFPKFLNEALQQGIYREYQRKEYNDVRVRGYIDINRQIRQNIPFNGRIAYRTREFSQDNAMTELIRHTIEYIRTQKIGKSLLDKDAEIRANVNQIIAVTPSYCRNDREKTIRNNQRLRNHPYFTRYNALQLLCLKMLRHEKVKYGNSDNEIYGILIDVSYLWEEYLAILLAKHGFRHPQNRSGIGRIYLAKGGKLLRYPDYYDKEPLGIIIDAKYKPTVVDRNDIHQLIAYMYRLRGKYGVFIHPADRSSCNEELTYSLSGYGDEDNAEIKIYPFRIPQVSDYEEFKRQIKESEAQLAFNCAKWRGMSEHVN